MRGSADKELKAACEQQLAATEEELRRGRFDPELTPRFLRLLQTMGKTT